MRDPRNGFTLVEVEHFRETVPPTHVHPVAYFNVLRRGGYWERFGRTEVTYTPGSIHFHAPGLVHDDHILPGGAHFLLVEIDDALFRRACDGASRPTDVHDLRGGELAHVGRRLDRELRDPARRSALVVEGIVLEMLGLVTRAPGAEAVLPKWLSGVLERIHVELDRPLTIQRLAAASGVHPVRLSRGFRRRMGTSVGEYVQRERVRWVEARLGSDGVSLAQLALEAGFVDQSHMTRVFRRVTGRTPGEARRVVRTSR